MLRKLVYAFVGSQLIVTLATPILTALYPPEIFGSYAYLFSYVSVCAAIGTLRSDVNYARAKSRTQEITCIILAVRIAALSGLILCTYLILTQDAVVSQSSALMAGCLVVLLSLQSLIYAERLKVKQTSKVANSRLRYAIAQITSQSLLGLVWMTPSALLAGQAVGATFGNAHDLRRYGSIYLRQRLSVDSTAEKSYLSASFSNSSSTLLNSISLAVPLILITKVFGSGVAGHYFLATRIVSLPIQLGLQVLSQYFGIAHAALAPEERRAKVKHVVGKSVAAGAVFGLVSLPAIYVLFPIIFGHQWEQAKSFAMVLLPSAVARIAAIPISQTLLMTGQSGYQWRWEVSRLVLHIVPFGAAATLGLTPVVTVALFSTTSMISYFMLIQLLISRPRS